MGSRGEDSADYGFPPARGGRGAPSMFPRKLFQILCETDPTVVGWDTDGESFHIAKLEKFVEEVMPQFYRHNKLTSFQRQLNLYGELQEELQTSRCIAKVCIGRCLKWHARQFCMYTSVVLILISKPAENRSFRCKAAF